MATFTYNGPDERVFPTISVTVKPGDSFEAPDDFSVADVSTGSAFKKAAPAPTPTPPSAPSDTTQGA
jgi:hypothetical protein